MKKSCKNLDFLLISEKQLPCGLTRAFKDNLNNFERQLEKKQLKNLNILRADALVLKTT